MNPTLLAALKERSTLEQQDRSYAEKILKAYPGHIKELHTQIVTVHKKTGAFTRKQHVARHTDTLIVPKASGIRLPDGEKASEIYPMPEGNSVNFRDIVALGQKSGGWYHGVSLLPKGLRAGKPELDEALESYQNPPTEPPVPDHTLKMRRSSSSVEGASAGTYTGMGTSWEDLPRKAPSLNTASTLALMERAKTLLSAAKQEGDEVYEPIARNHPESLSMALHLMGVTSAQVGLQENKDAVSWLTQLMNRHGGATGLHTLVHGHPGLRDAILGAKMRVVTPEEKAKGFNSVIGWREMAPEHKALLGFHPDSTTFSINKGEVQYNSPLIVNPRTGKGSQATPNVLGFLSAVAGDPQGNTTTPEGVSLIHKLIHEGGSFVSPTTGETVTAAAGQEMRAQILDKKLGLKPQGMQDKTLQFAVMGRHRNAPGAIMDVHAASVIDQALGGPGYSLTFGGNLYNPMENWYKAAIVHHLDAGNSAPWFDAFSASWSAVQGHEYLEHASFFKMGEELKP